MDMQHSKERICAEEFRTRLRLMIMSECLQDRVLQ